MSLNTLEAPISSRDDLERLFKAPSFSYEPTPVKEAGTLMDNETDVSLRFGRTLLSVEQMRQKREAQKSPEVVYSPTTAEQIQQIGVNIMVMRKDALGLVDNVKGSNSYK